MRNRTSIQPWLPATTIAAALLTVTLLLPGIVAKRSGSVSVLSTADFPQTRLEQQTKPLLVPIYLTREQKIDQVPLETYVRNVVAAEMPANFEFEALKAQAIASRTYIVKRLLEGDSSQVPVQGAVVTDTVAHQAYIGEEQMKANWGEADYPSRLDKLNRAVNETAGVVVTYQGKPIQASFFSTSNGYTENSEEYWRDYIPYLRSVPSPWDQELSPKYMETKTMSLQEFFKKLGITSVPAAATGSGAMKVLATTSGHRIKTVSAGGKSFTGREMREKLELNSSQFTWKISGSRIEITTYGYGHGVGMSQWGANGMAKEGKSAETILKYYYQGVELSRVSALLGPPV
ncbi:stage II sporulation protein D [Paenibacillus oceani]|uniref:Stage II sporulation protein D n=1 Tax=Paenibacillus oceani TaxID=2772510 RepID=A0A927CCU1_9BACL|nr:stage II sporulation protein D [Paenibacillus oceani]MBD2863606.1 stage II sporulation protein D [Paenibacillus oceani]